MERSGFLVQASGARRENYMNGDLKVGDVVEGSFGKMRVVEDFLPRPEELVLRAPKPATRKVTLILPPNVKTTKRWK